jgi:hypothetical protein
VAYGDPRPRDWETALSIELTERRSTVVTLAAWLWVIAMTLAYLAQFADYVRPILTLLG